MGVQFSPLVDFTAAHFGRFWDVLGDEWVNPKDLPPIADQFELFDQPAPNQGFSFRFNVGQVASTGRMQLTKNTSDRIIQVQNSRMHLNWSRTDKLKPSYGELHTEFEDCYEKFSRFLRERSLGDLRPNQWEVTYVDCFKKGEFWSDPKDWKLIFPGLFGSLFDFDAIDLKLNHRNAYWVFELKDKKGRLHVRAQSNVGPDNVETLLVDWTARGPASTFVEVKQGLKIGKEAAVAAFFKAASSEIVASWQEK